jgi:hypothetical protein
MGGGFSRSISDLYAAQSVCIGMTVFRRRNRETEEQSLLSFPLWKRKRKNSLVLIYYFLVKKKRKKKILFFIQTTSFCSKKTSEGFGLGLSRFTACRQPTEFRPTTDRHRPRRRTAGGGKIFYRQKVGR